MEHSAAAGTSMCRTARASTRGGPALPYAPSDVCIAGATLGPCAASHCAVVGFQYLTRSLDLQCCFASQTLGAFLPSDDDMTDAWLNAGNGAQWRRPSVGIWCLVSQKCCDQVVTLLSAHQTTWDPTAVWPRADTRVGFQPAAHARRALAGGADKPLSLQQAYSTSCPVVS